MKRGQIKMTIKLEKVVNKFYDGLEEGKILGRKCPQCGQEEMAYQNGCLTCMSCGYSKCG